MSSSPQENSDWRALYPFKANWADLPGGRMHYLDVGPHAPGSDGEKTTLLFVHGNPTWSFHWRRLISALREKYRCVAPDHIGCGLSEKPQRFLELDDHVRNLLALVDEMKLDRITLVAQDWGGAIGLGALMRLRERVQRIVLFNTGAFTPRYIPWRIRACRWPVVGRLAVQGANAFSIAALRMTLARKSRLEPNVASGYLAPYNSWQNRRAVYGFVRDIPSPRKQFDPGAMDDSTWGALTAIEHALPRFGDRPICLIWGMRDWCFRPDCLERFLKAWPHAESHRLADVGHWVVEDAPEEALSIVTQFLATTSPNRERSVADAQSPGNR
jgi:haloalkane dehalogenase